MKHVLMVDDVTTNLMCAAEVLKDFYKVSMVKSGEQALQFLENCIPDLILLDISMPNMDGYETMERIKQSPQWNDIPVIFLTADTDGESEIRGLQMGAMDYIHKPFEPKVVLSRIQKILNMEETKRDLELTARKDPLTGLWNRRYMEENLLTFTKTEQHCGAFFLMDLDNFKSVNDNLGHLMGDAVLVQFAKCLQEIIEEKDILCRIGGDEFIIFFPGLTRPDVIKQIAKTINKDVIEIVNRTKGAGCDISASIGIAMMPEDGDDLKTLYNKSDKALYFVKENGKSGFHFYQEKDVSVLQSDVRSKGVAVDLKQLRALIQEKTQSVGAYEVEYGGFKKIYQFLSRTVKRSKRNVQVVLFSLTEREDVIREIGALEKAMSNLDFAIVKSLRKGDVATNYSSSQYVVILMDTTTENGFIVAERIKNAWNEIDPKGVKCYDLHFDIEQIETGEI